MSGKNKSFIAFTLAEVLITLAIIGVVAAITIPALMNTTNKSEYVTAFKKEYSVLNNAWQQLIIDNGGSIVGAYATSDDVLEALCTKLKCTVKCTASNSSACFVSTNWKTLDNGNSWGPMAGASAILADGTGFSVVSYSPNCTNTTTNTTSTKYISMLCGVINFDTNTLNRQPNIIGRDIFELLLTRNNILPTGYPGLQDQVASVRCLPGNNNTYNGSSCGARILLEGAMNY